MKSSYRRQICRASRFFLAASTLLAFATLCTPATAQLPSKWQVMIGQGQGTVIGVASWGVDGDWDGGSTPVWWPDRAGVYIALYREPGPNWSGPKALYPEDYDKTPIPSGGSRTWSGLYLWAQNMTPAAGRLTKVAPGSGEGFPTPPGYLGHLVLDHVPSACDYQGPMDFWMDLSSPTYLALPIPVVTNPFTDDVTQFSFTVYAPEPSSLLAIAAGIGALGLVARRRRR